MNSDRIEEIHKSTAYPDSQSVLSALNQVWNEIEQNGIRKKIKKGHEILSIKCLVGSYNQDEYMRGMINGMKLMMSVFDGVNPEFISQPDNLVPEAINILRGAMKDKSDGELYFGWMCNIKYAIYDQFDFADMTGNDKRLIEQYCEDGAKLFLDRLLNNES